MARTDFIEPLADDATRKFGPIAVAAEMAQIQVAQLTGNNFSGHFRGGIVR